MERVQEKEVTSSSATSTGSGTAINVSNVHRESIGYLRTFVMVLIVIAVVLGVLCVNAYGGN